MLIPAFILGLLSSLHCIGMCGPLALSLPKNNQNRFTGPLTYNLGRITTYSILGIFFGTIGKSLAWFGWQQTISITLGVIILLSITLPVFTNRIHFFKNAADKYMLQIRKGMSRFLFQSKPYSLFAFGSLNGLLPCGMVYMAIAGAIATGNSLNGTLFMALFGLGTLPAMWLLAFSGNLIKSEIRMAARKLYTPMMMIMAILLIIRGLNLDIPYLSPSLHISNSQQVNCHR